MVQPCNLVDQFTLTDTSKRVNKKQLTHNLLFWITKMNALINKQCDMDKYPGMVYEFCLHQIIHYICALRLRFPTKGILISKYDFSNAYQRIAHSARAVAQNILVIDNIAYLCLRLSYDGAPNPPTFCCFSETVNDLSNKLPLMIQWDLKKLYSPLQLLVSKPEYVKESVPIASAKPMAVNIPTTILGRGDVFIDDIIKVYIDRPEQIQCHGASAPLVVHAAMRPFFWG